MDPDDFQNLTGTFLHKVMFLIKKNSWRSDQFRQRHELNCTKCLSRNEKESFTSYLAPFPSYGRLLIRFSLATWKCLTLTPSLGVIACKYPQNVYLCRNSKDCPIKCWNRTIVPSFIWTKHGQTTGRTGRNGLAHSSYYSGLQCGRAAKMVGSATMWSYKLNNIKPVL